MFPIRDENPSGTFPLVSLGIIAVNVGVFVLESSMPEDTLEAFVASFGLVPARVWRAAVGQEGLAGVLAVIPPFLTSMFLHGGLLHLLGNMWFLWIFGDNIEDRLGHLGFLVFYIVCGLVASLTHIIFVGKGSVIPMVGASGAISGVLGAYFICFPRARVVTLIPFFIFVHFARFPAWFFLFVWLLGQMLGASAAEPGSPGIAWFAHLGGFAAGAFLALLWPRCEESRQTKYTAYPDVWRSRRRIDF